MASAEFYFSLVGALVGVSGGLAGIYSVYIAHLQWRKVNKKVAMLTESEQAFEVVPAWYAPRMMDDHWLFALQTSDGRTYAVRRITAISDDQKWMDVELATEDDARGVGDRYGPLIVAVAEDRTRASLRIDHIVAAFDLWTS